MEHSIQSHGTLSPTGSKYLWQAGFNGAVQLFDLRLEVGHSRVLGTETTSQPKPKDSAVAKSDAAPRRPATPGTKVPG
jgi:hypothetical protein